MSFKSPFALGKLKTIKGSIYHKALKMILTKKMVDGASVPFYLILNHIFNGFDKSKSEKLPFLVLGTPNGGNEAWKKFAGKIVEGTTKKQKDFMVVGTFKRAGNNFVLEINRGKGLSKIPPVTLNRLKALVSNINKDYTLSVGQMPDTSSSNENKEETQEEKAPPTAAPKVGKTKAPVDEAKKAAYIAKHIKEKQEEAKELNDSFKEFETLFKSRIGKLTENIKKGATTRKDLDFIKNVNQLYSKTIALHKAAPRQVKKKFKKSYAQLNDKKKELYKISMATKKSRKSVAGLMADSYFNRKYKRPAEKAEIKAVQKIIKDTFAMNKKRRKKGTQALLLTSISYVLKKTGIDNFKTKYVNQILQKKVA